jgi:hypothetical protein
MAGVFLCARDGRKEGVMPKERVRHSGSNSFADVMVRWEKEGHGQATNGVEDCKVDLFIVASDLPGRGGSYMFTPENPEAFGLAEGESAGPISIDLDRGQINRLIRVLRQARDSAYGADA